MSEPRQLRALHAEMDRAVLEVYGWTEAGKKRKRKPYRYRWPDDVRDEVLARLIELNRTRADDERRRGIAVARSPRPTDEDDEPTD